MNNIYNLARNLSGEKIGSVSISMYTNKDTNMNFFYIQSDNENMLQVSYVIEDALRMY